IQPAGLVAVKYCVFRIISEWLAQNPGVPAQARLVVCTFSQAAHGHVSCLEYELYIEIKLRSNIKTYQVAQQEKRLALGHVGKVGNVLRELPIIERTQANPKLALHVPDAVADNEVDPQLTVAVEDAHARLVGRFELQPLPLELLHLCRQSKIIDKYCLQC